MSNARRWRLVMYACVAWTILFLAINLGLYLQTGQDYRSVYWAAWVGIAAGFFARYKARMRLGWPFDKRRKQVSRQ